MTDNEIIKALEYCTSSDISHSSCRDCPCFEHPEGCVTLKDALALILRQKAEIERLTTELVGMRGAANSYKMHYDKSQAENKELWGERNRIYESFQETKSDLEEYRKAYSKAKSEARKEFAERLKNSFCISKEYLDVMMIIDNLLAEMESERK